MELYDLDVEKAVLGCLLLYNNHMDYAMTNIKSTTFYDPKHQKIFDLMCQQYLDSDAHSFDMITISSALNQMPGNTIQPYDVVSLTENGRGVNFPYYVDVVRQLALRRHVCGIAKGLALVSAKEGTDIEASVQCSVNLLLDAISGVSESDIVTLRKTYEKVLQTIDRHRQDPDTVDGFITGIPGIDEYGGLERGTLTILAGRPSNGKSALALNMARRNAEAGCSVAYFTLEMTCERLASRILADSSLVPGQIILSKALDDDDYRRVTEAMNVDNETCLSDRIFFDGSNSPKFEVIAAKIRMLVRTEKINGVVIDYIQQMNISRQSRDDNEARQLGDIAHGLQKLAVELNIPIVVLSQLNRNPATGDNMPRLSDLRGSGAIEEAADNVLLIHRPEADGRGYASDLYSNADPHNTAILISAKARNGVSGHHYFLRFIPARTRFEVIDKLPEKKYQEESFL